jgi:hypothetical protein
MNWALIKGEGRARRGAIIETKKYVPDDKSDKADCINSSLGAFAIPITHVTCL